MDPGRIRQHGTEPAAPGKQEPFGADTLQPVAPPAQAYARGWMPLSSTGADDFRRAHPAYDGRGVLIGILDTGIDPAIPGLQRTSTGEPKVLDLREFSDEGSIALVPVTATADQIAIGARRLRGAGRLAALGTGRWYGGLVREIPLGLPPAADLNGNGRLGDTLAVVVTHATDGWVLFADTDGDGTLANERPYHDYLVGRETFGWAPRGVKPAVTLAVNFTEAGRGSRSATDAAPRLDLVILSGAHGSHVAGIAAAHDLYGVAGFDGVAPGAQLLGLKIANSAQGGISTTGSMLRAIDYAIRFASARRLPLVLNMSFGVGNEIEGGARIDRIVDSVLAAHPEIVFAISAGNDGPGLSTIGFPGSASLAISVGATLPPAFLPQGPGGQPASEQIAFFSSRGGPLAKPDLVTPGAAYSSVPRWNRGEEVEQGTSMASPHAAGLAALLVSGLAQQRTPVSAHRVKQALMVTAQPLPGATYLDQGTGLPDVGRAWQWLATGLEVPQIRVLPVGRDAGVDAAFRERVSGAPPDTTQTFELSGGTRATASFTLRSDAPWLTAPTRVALRDGAGRVTVRYARDALRRPGVYVGTVSGWTRDTLAGPAFRLVSTIIVANPISSDSTALRAAVRVPAGSALRTFFEADSGRGFELTVGTVRPGQNGLAFLHEPEGMPFRGDAALPAGPGGQAASYHVDARDAIRGAYEVDAVAPPTGPVDVTVRVRHAPLLLSATRRGDRVSAGLRNPTRASVEAEAGMLIGGGERTQAISERGSAVKRIPLVAPAWARGVIVDLAMDRAQWGRFTDFGVTLLDSVGRQIDKKPLNYAFGRLSAELPKGHGDMPVVLALFPGFADSDSNASWTVRATIRLYADSAVALRPVTGAGGTAPLTVAPGAAASATFAIPPSPWTLPAGFDPLGVILVRTSAETWTRELALPESPAASR